MNTAIAEPMEGAGAAQSNAALYDLPDLPWSAIFEPDTSLVVERRNPDAMADAAHSLLRLPPFCRIGQGEFDSAIADLGELPSALANDIITLATRFAELTGSQQLRIRLEQVVTNSCRKVHTDYTDLRLITTYAGPGTQIPFGNNPTSHKLLDVPAGHVGIFKGRRFNPVHTPCFHRSPPAGDLRIKRLVLVIDTISFVTESECS